MQAAYDNGWITLGTYEGLYCVACEAYYTESDLVDGLCPVHHRPVELLKEDNYFFRLSAFSDRLLEWYAENPEAVTPKPSATKPSASSRRGFRIFRSPAPRSTGACGSHGTKSTCFTCGTTRSSITPPPSVTARTRPVSRSGGRWCTT